MDAGLFRHHELETYFVNTLPALLPVARIWDNPMQGEQVIPMFEYCPSVDTQLREWIPPGCGRCLLVVNGVALMQNEWHRPVLPGDVIDWHLLSCGGGNNNGTSRQVLSIIAVIVIAYFTAGLGTAAGGTLSAVEVAAVSIGLNIAAQVLINAIIPIKAVDVTGVSAGSVYNVALSANQARLNQPIPVIYGRMRTYPDFAAQPYSYYDNDNNQFYAAVFCIGQGSFAIERVQIDDTNIRNFSNVSYRIRGPGQALTLVAPNVITVPEVAGVELKAGVYTAGFTVCAAGYSVTRIEVDIGMDQGIGYMENDGSITPFPLDLGVYYRYIDDFGVPTSGWTTLMTPNITGATRTPVRRTFGADITTPGRLEVRMARLTIAHADDNHFVTTANWTSLRAKVSMPSAPLHANATHLEVLMQANEQLSGLNQRKVNVIARRKLPVWRMVSSVLTEQPAEEYRGIAWAIADIWRATYGARQPITTADMDTLYRLEQVWSARQDRLDILFDTRITVKEALKIVSQVGRSVAYQRMGMLTVARDEQQDTPVTGFGGRNIVPGSVAITYLLPTPETADAVIIEYFDNRIWDWVPITCPVPGVTTPVNPVTVRVAGITGSYHAQREGLKMAAENLYRRKFPKWQTELLGRLPTYGSGVLFAPAMPGWAQSGDVVDFSGLTLVLSEPVTFTAGVANYISLLKIDGSYTAAIAVTPGADAYTVTLAASPGFSPIVADAERERTRYIFGPGSQKSMMVRLLGVQYKGHSGGSGPLVELTGVVEDDRVHAADNAYLPAGGVIQNPVSSDLAGDLDTPPSTPTTGGSSAFYVAVVNDDIVDNSTLSGAPQSATLTFKNTGLVVAAGPTTIYSRAPWMLYGAVDPSIAALYEIQAVVSSSFALSSGGDVLTFVPGGTMDGAWRNLSTDQVFNITIGAGETISGLALLQKYVAMTVAIRDVATHTVQDTGSIVLHVTLIV